MARQSTASIFFTRYLNSRFLKRSLNSRFTRRSMPRKEYRMRHSTGMVGAPDHVAARRGGGTMVESVVEADEGFYIPAGNRSNHSIRSHHTKTNTHTNPSVSRPSPSIDRRGGGRDTVTEISQQSRSRVNYTVVSWCLMCDSGDPEW